MGVGDPRVVDVVSLSRELPEVVLTIADDLGWDSEEEHLAALDAKVEAYRAYVASGELHDAYPSTIGRRVRIDVVFLHPPPVLSVDAFLARARAALAPAGVALSCRGRPSR